MNTRETPSERRKRLLDVLVAQARFLETEELEAARLCVSSLYERSVEVAAVYRLCGEVPPCPFALESDESPK